MGSRGLVHGGPTTWYKSQEPAGYERYGTGCCGDTFASSKPINTLQIFRRFSADMMKMMRANRVRMASGKMLNIVISV